MVFLEASWKESHVIRYRELESSRLQPSNRSALHRINIKLHLLYTSTQSERFFPGTIAGSDGEVK